MISRRIGRALCEVDDEVSIASGYLRGHIGYLGPQAQ